MKDKIIIRDKVQQNLIKEIIEVGNRIKLKRGLIICNKCENNNDQSCKSCIGCINSNGNKDLFVAKIRKKRVSK